MVTKTVPSGELFETSELSLTDQLTENAESVPLGVFAFPPVFLAFFDSPPVGQMSLVRAARIRSPDATCRTSRFSVETL